MANFIPFNRDQASLLPPDLKAWVSEDDLASSSGSRLWRRNATTMASSSIASTVDLAPLGQWANRRRARIKRGGHHSRYRLRKYVVEPVFGQIKQARGFRQFLLRGMKKVSSEWAMICTAHNLAKLTR
jgi:hypothetical protein